MLYTAKKRPDSTATEPDCSCESLNLGKTAIGGIIENVRGLATIAMRIITSFKPEQRGLSDIAVLPYSVRYTIRYNASAGLGEREIRDMIPARFYGTGLYLVLKLLDCIPNGAPIFQDALGRIINCLAVEGNGYSELEPVLEEVLSDAKIDSSIRVVSCAKIAQLNRQGHDLIDQRFSVIAENVKEDGNCAFLVGHAGLIGLKPFLDSLDESNPWLGILLPSGFKGCERGDTCGYLIKFESAGKYSATPINKGTDLTQIIPNNIVLVDNTRRSGKTLNLATEMIDSLSNWPKVVGHGFATCTYSGSN